MKPCPGTLHGNHCLHRSRPGVELADGIIFCCICRQEDLWVPEGWEGSD